MSFCFVFSLRESLLSLPLSVPVHRSLPLFVFVTLIIRNYLRSGVAYTDLAPTLNENTKMWLPIQSVVYCTREKKDKNVSEYQLNVGEI